MSRSVLRDRYKKSYWHDAGARNQHRRDEAPKNRLPKFLQTRIDPVKIDWLQKHSVTWSHRPVKGGHSRVSGIVRQKLKEEFREEIRDCP